MRDSTEPGMLQRWRWPLIVGLPVLMALVAHTVFTPCFQSNDDSGMAMFAAGYGLGTRPSPFLIFMHPLLGQFLSGLYTLSPSVPWYALFMLGVRLLAGMAVSFAALERRPTLLRVGLVAVYLLALDLSGHVCPQFSRAAVAASQGAVLLWLSRCPERPWNVALAAAAAALLTLGIIIRPDPDYAILALELAAPLVLLDLLATLRGRGDGVALRARLLACAGRTGVPLLTAGILVGGLLAYRTWYYAASPGWSDFFHYARLRSQFTDFCRNDSTPATDRALARVGWSNNDLAMIKSWFFADRQVYSADKLRAFLETSQARRACLPELKSQAWVLWTNHFLRLPLTAIFFMALFVPGRAWLRFGSVCLTAGVAWWLVAGVMRHYCPQHFVQALLAFVAAVGVVLAGPVRFGLLRKAGWVLGMLAVVYFTGRVCWKLHGRSIHSQAMAAELKSDVEELNPQPDQLYVVWGAYFPFEYVLPFDSWSYMRNFKCYGLNCATNTPVVDERLRELAIDDLVTALYTRNDVFVICDDPMPAMLETYLAEHRGFRVQMVLVYDTHTELLPQKRLFRVYRAVRVQTEKTDGVGPDAKQKSEDGKLARPSQVSNRAANSARSIQRELSGIPAKQRSSF